MTLSLVDANTERDAGNDADLHTAFDEIRRAEEDLLAHFFRSGNDRLKRGSVLEAIDHTRRAFDLLVRHAEGMRS